MKLDSVSTELTPHYYRDNFLLLCDTVERQYGDLLEPAELSWLESYRRLDFVAQCLYVRLISRVGPWFRQSKLAYPELGQLHAAIDILLEQGLALEAQGLSVEELGALFTRAELLQVFGPLMQSPRPRDKPSLLAAIAELGLSPQAYLRELGALEADRIITPLAVDLVELLQLLFFGNRHQSLTEFVLSDLGIARYYPYPLDREHRLFRDRQAVEEYLACAQCRDSWYELREIGDQQGLLSLASEMLAADIRYTSSESRWHRTCNDLARDLERLGELETALQLYNMSRRHPARERRARVLEARGDWTDAALLCQQILAGPWCEEEQEAAGRILARARRQLEGGKVSRRRDQFPKIMLELPRDSRPVELLAAVELASPRRSVHYVENQLMNTLFGLAFWEQIFAPVPGAFHNPYQSVPADMYEPDFRLRRQAELDARLQQLRAVDLSTELSQAYNRYSPCQCRWVNWRYIEADLLEQAVAVIPREHLLAVWERMLFDPRENRRGFPDLIALGEAPGDYRLIEVKGPGDALQDSQKRWLRFFGETGIPATVAWVTWRDD